MRAIELGKVLQRLEDGLAEEGVTFELEILEWEVSSFVGNLSVNYSGVVTSSEIFVELKVDEGFLQVRDIVNAVEGHIGKGA